MFDKKRLLKSTKDPDAIPYYTEPLPRVSWIGRKIIKLSQQTKANKFVCTVNTLITPIPTNCSINTWP